MRDWPAPGDTLDRQSVDDLYRGALLLESKVRRIQGAALVLLLARLGLSLDEALHLHVGWIDWERGVVEIPDKDPCACPSCWDVARDRRDHTESITDALYEECWSPAESRTARTVPFGWSDRITAALSTVYDRWDVLDMSPDDAKTMLQAAARKADDPAADVTPAVLSASTVPFLLDLGLGVQSAAALLGVPDRAVAAYDDGHSDPVAQLERLADGVDAGESDSAAEFPVALGTEAYPAEPFGLADVGPETLARRAAESTAPSRVPRETERPESVDYDPADHEQAGPPTRRDSVHDAATGSTGGEPPAAEYLSEPIGDESTDTTPSASEDLLDVDAPAMGDDQTVPDGTPTSHDDDHDSGATSTPRDAVSQPVVADVSTRIAADGLAGGREIDGRIVLGQSELFVVQARADGTAADPESTPHRYVPLDTVWDVKIDHVPQRFDTSFRRTVTVVYRPADADRFAVTIQLPAAQRKDLADALYRLLLNVTPTSVAHPARVAGRVTDADPRRMVMYVRPDRLTFADRAAESVECAFELDDVVHVDRVEREADGETRPVVEVRHVTDNRPVTTTVSMPDACLQRLAWRYVRLEYHQTLTAVRDLPLSDSEKMVLVALYSTDGTPDLDSILGLDPQELDGGLQSLAAKDLIRSAQASTALTGRGQLAVSDRLESVND